MYNVCTMQCMHVFTSVSVSVHSRLSGRTWNTESKSSEQTSLSDSRDLSEGEEEEEEGEEGESDSGWLEEDDLMSDVGEDGIGIEGSLLSRGTWELESIGAESHETDSGHLISDHLSPHRERRGVCTSTMIPARVCYPGEKEGGISSALTPSLFPNLQPTIHFPLPNENCKLFGNN